ncbi:MAG: hypothetical protein ACK4IK_09795 [Bacteroidia bacterium]
MNMKFTLTLIFAFSLSAYVFSQNVGINTTGAAPNASAMLDIDAAPANNRGLLIPRVALTATNAVGPIAGPAQSLLVYNTATAGTPPNNVTPGFYYWNGAAWVRLLNNTGNNGVGWLTTGNAGTTVASNFLGTTDNIPLAIRTNNVERMRILNNGQVVINNTAPFAGDVFSAFAAGSDYAINGYSSGSGAGIYSQNTSSGNSIVSLHSSTGGNLIVSNTNTATGRAGEFQSLNTNGTEITLFATNQSTNLATTFSAIWGQSSGTRGIVGLSSRANNNSIGINGQYIGGGNFDAIGVLGLANSNANWGYGVFGQGNWRALYGNGNFAATGTKAFQIDHPLDPENKFLLHYSIESPEVLNVYRGQIILDSNGEAIIELPDYFSSINTNFTYQLTPVGAQMPNLYISEEIQTNTFKISGGTPNKKVCWFVYAERNDEWVKQNPTSKSVELVKKEHEKGKYLRPELYKQPKEKAIFNVEEKFQSLQKVNEKNIK